MSRVPVFPVPHPLTPDWLNFLLSRSGALPSGQVIEIEAQATDAFNSATHRLRVRYSADALADAPKRLILKRNVASDWGREAGADEARFYALVDSLADHPGVLAPSYAAEVDDTSGDSLILLRDLSASHRPPRTRDQQVGIVDGVPDAADVAAVVATLARFHAYWWEHPLLDAGHFAVGYWSRTRERFDAYLARRSSSWERVLAQHGDWLPAEVRALYDRVFASLPAYWEQHLAPRFAAMSHLTVTHGDAYFANFLCPVPPASGPTYLIDWQSPGADIGAYDLVNLCATFWTREQRHEGQREEDILRHYLATLHAHGVSGYTWDDLLLDYRRGLIFWLLMPVQDAADGSARDYWWPKMQCLLDAFQDWRCEELLTP